jgi:hypothetical protein
MTRLYVAMQDRMVIVSGRNSHWSVAYGLPHLPLTCVAVDPRRPEMVYCGSFGKGLWHSADGGASWKPAGEGITSAQVTSVAVGDPGQVGSLGVVWAGTEPSAIFRSEDGGATWTEPAVLTDIPSSSSWSFPPRPYTHHTRWIAPDANQAGRILVSIEAGGVMRSLDEGRSWEDRKPGGPYDAHTIVSHRMAPGWVYVAAGDGYAESHDGGSSWRWFTDGLRHHYLWSVATDTGDPEVVVLSAARGPREAHDPGPAASTVYRRASGGEWQEASEGLPEEKGTIIPELATNPAEPGMFYLASNRGVFKSADSGLTWEQLEIPWPEDLRHQHVQGLAVSE